MSAILEQMERNARAERIVDPVTIEELLDCFLDMSFEELTGGIERHKWLVECLASGFVLDQSKLESRSMREILMLIGYTPAVPWFEIPDDDKWFYDNGPDRKFFSAESCFSLGRVINERKESVPVIRQLLQTDFISFTEYLLKKTGNDKRIANYLIRIRVFFGKCRKREIEAGRPGMSNERFTLGDVLMATCRNGHKAWICGYSSLNRYVDDVRRSYDIMRILFMDCIRMSLISSDRNRLKELLDACSETGKYDQDYYEQFDFTDCYE